MVLNNPCQDYPDWMPRVFYPAFRGIIIRGIERKPIFKDKIDYGNFIDRLSKV
jgi:hypothetical protein